MPISRLLYTSRSCLVPAELTVEQQASNIAARAAIRNKEVGITGVLVFVEDHFIQLIEGEGPVVEDVFERICCDFDHAQVRLVDLVGVKDRMFDRWHMAELSGSENAGSPLDEELQHIRFLMGVNARVAVEKMHECLLECEANGLLSPA
ncbi:BLUF domain-containing protein [Qipengyuania sp. SS22]|uniref:BLUF domain-containing protein n=1 Tax=Qipengyuania sp. SS22 TaxID=2979461 RepID=UPI0021E55D56|nr:BLUF domain-containing protein [Qipengyuania sp. SS22]UYH55139.1 BLUF domain-containing protein [Qipengyuania sp. SS22]